MLVPPKRLQQAPDALTTSKKQPSIVTREMSIETRLAAPPVKKVKSARKVKATKEVTIIDPYQNDNAEPRRDENYEVKPPLEEGSDNTAPFGKLASKMKLMLRRRSTGDKKKEKKEKEKEKDYYDPVEDVHWTEM
jgi:pyruvate dehydrogenase phosphatase